MDGARIFNASVATNTPLDRMVREYDSISICLSKGLGAPIGSVLVGSHTFIAQAHRWRKMFGGGMRQAGMLAAAGLHALDHHVERMVEDHARATQLATSINAINGFTVDLSTVETNMVYFDSEIPATSVMDALATSGIDVLDIGPHSCRIVVHLHITDEDVSEVLRAFEKIA
jgi:threonine aldolase